MRKIFYIFFLITSCSNAPEKMKSSDLIKWFNDSGNGFVNNQEVGEIRFSAQLRPVDYQIALDHKSDFINEEEYRKAKERIDRMTYFSLRISSDFSPDVMLHNAEDEQVYFERDMYYSYEFSNDIYLITDDTVQCSIYHFVNSHGLTPYIESVFAFEKDASRIKDPVLVIDDKVFGSGIVKFSFDDKVLKNQPELEIL